MVKLRLRRVGLRNQPSYRIVAADKEKSRDGRFLEIVGFYNPRTEPSTIELKEDRIFSWLSQGALPSDSVAKIFREVGLLERYEKFKSGTSVESLAEEAKKAAALRVVNPKTKNVTVKTISKKAKENLKAKETAKPEEVKSEAPKSEKPKTEEPKTVEPESVKPESQETAKIDEAPKTEE